MQQNKKPALVILAAGMGSRYGGLKQMDTFTAEGDTILDFSIYDAIQAGFGKIIFIIRKKFEEKFKAVFEKKLKGSIEYDFVFQETENVPEKFINPERTKPWGTGHALLMAKEVIEENFAVINADDFYGKEAFELMAKNLSKKNLDHLEFYMISYRLKNTISEFGHVSRGECVVDKNGFLQDITERTHIEKIENQLFRKNENNQLISIDKKTIVSMNFWGFTPKYFEFGDELFLHFLENNRTNLKAEFYIPSVVKEIITSKKAKIKVLNSDAKWFGVTYKKDKNIVVNAIATLKQMNIYPKKLW